MPFTSSEARSGILVARLKAEYPDRVRYSAQESWWERDLEDGWPILVLRHSNGYVRSGLRNGLLREFGLGGTAIGYFGVDNNATAVTFDTRFLHGASAGTQPPTASANQVIKAISPAATAVTDGAGVVQTVTAGASFQNSDFTGGGNSVFVINKVGLLLAATDADGNLVDVIGGSGGTAPYARPFTLDATSVGSFTFAPSITVTNAAA